MSRDTGRTEASVTRAAQRIPGFCVTREDTRSDSRAKHLRPVSLGPRRGSQACGHKIRPEWPGAPRPSGSLVGERHPGWRGLSDHPGQVSMSDTRRSGDGHRACRASRVLPHRGGAPIGSDKGAGSPRRARHMPHGPALEESFSWHPRQRPPVSPHLSSPLFDGFAPLLLPRRTRARAHARTPERG